MLRRLITTACLLCSTGCSMLPELARQPTFHNPFPQLSKVAVAPFFNLTSEATLDGHRVALAYFNELQLIPGFEVVPVGVVEVTMKQHNISLRGPAEARRLAQLLDVDALIVGAVTDYSPYYPPRCGLQVEWYAANPAFHPIPAGYGLPWGKPEEQDIPAPLVFEAEMALAKAQLATQTPPMEKLPEELPGPNQAAANGSAADPLKPPEANGGRAWQRPGTPGTSPGDTGIKPLQYTAPVGAGAVAAQGCPGGSPEGFPPNWPDPRGFIPPPPKAQPPCCWPSEAPVIRHTRTYNGHDSDFTEALNSYYFFRSDARYGGWQGYLQRSDDFILFCCHMHVAETLTARGGAGETRVVWRWPLIR
jgi:hypothetical protein